VCSSDLEAPAPTGVEAMVQSAMDVASASETPTEALAEADAPVNEATAPAEERPRAELPADGERAEEAARVQPDDDVTEASEPVAANASQTPVEREEAQPEAEAAAESVATDASKATPPASEPQIAATTAPAAAAAVAEQPSKSPSAPQGVVETKPAAAAPVGNKPRPGLLLGRAAGALGGPIAHVLAWPLAGRSKTVRDSAGWIAINTVFWCACLWTWLVFFRHPATTHAHTEKFDFAHSTVPEVAHAPESHDGSGEATQAHGDDAHGAPADAGHGGGHGEVEASTAPADRRGVARREIPNRLPSAQPKTPAKAEAGHGGH